MESSNELRTPAKRPRSRWLKRSPHGDRRWLRTYWAKPAAHGRGKSAAVLAALAILAVSGLGLLVVGR